ncbi:MAG TPA: AAA family ATPase [Candidatus Tumulicola sp.]|jgi:hypothetical protein
MNPASDKVYLIPALRAASTSEQEHSLSGITVLGFKSIERERTLRFNRLTILAGANSSGKSSIMQPLLLQKQTVEAEYDASPFALDGPNVSFDRREQLLSRNATSMRIGLESSSGRSIAVEYRSSPKESKGKAFDVCWQQFKDLDGTFTFREGMSPKEIDQLVEPQVATTVRDQLRINQTVPWELLQDRSFLSIGLGVRGVPQSLYYSSPGRFVFWNHLTNIIHLPGLRTSPQRNYPVANVTGKYRGTFDRYTASVIARWEDSDSDRIKALAGDLLWLGLTNAIRTDYVSDSSVGILVGRTTRPRPVPKRRSHKRDSEDLVNIADVGLGVSQVLPVLVALIAAVRNQIVYLEQPEIHLHPLAQLRLARIIARAVRSGVKVVVETHSSVLLRGLQTEIARGTIPFDAANLYWFRKRGTATQIDLAVLDERGSFGDWPLNFGDVRLQADRDYLLAVQKQSDSTASS